MVRRDGNAWSGSSKIVQDELRCLGCPGQSHPPHTLKLRQRHHASSCYKTWIIKLLPATIEAIFTVCSTPNINVGQCPLLLEKWFELFLGWSQTILGLDVDSNRLSVRTSDSYLEQVQELLKSKWHPNRKYFWVNELQKLIRELGQIGEGAPWIYKLMSHLYTSLIFSLKNNKAFLKASSNEFKALVTQIKRKQFILWFMQPYRKRFAMQWKRRQRWQITTKWCIQWMRWWGRIQLPTEGFTARVKYKPWNPDSPHDSNNAHRFTLWWQFAHWMWWLFAQTKLFMWHLDFYIIPVDLLDKESICIKIFIAREWEEDIAKQHSPITKEMTAEVLNKSQMAASKDLFKVVFCNFLKIIQLLGLWVPEYAQTMQAKVDMHDEYSLGKHIVNAFTSLNWIIYGKNNAKINATSIGDQLTLLHKVKNTFWN